jgi:hypothetical protein
MITLFLTLAICGLIVWLILQLPMPEPFKTAIKALAIVFLILYLVRVFNLDLPLPGR